MSSCPRCPIGPNNWGDAGTFLRVVAADYAGDQREFDLAIEKWRSLIDLIEPDGRIPEEVRRGAAGISYTQEALQYKVAVAQIAERRGVNLWDYVGKQGGSLRKAIDRLAYYWHRPGDWPDFAGPTIPSTGPLWEIAYAHWQEPKWVDILLDGRPYGDRGHSAIRWTTLTNGVPIESLVAGGPSASPAATPPPIATVAPSATQAAPPIGGLAVTLKSFFGNSLPVAITWDAPAVAGASAELERSIAGGDWSAMKIASNGRSASDSLPLGRVTAYRVRAVVAGVAGPWTTLDDVSVARIEATSRTVDLSGAWERVAFNGYSGGSALSTDARGAKADLARHDAVDRHRRPDRSDPRPDDRQRRRRQGRRHRPSFQPIPAAQRPLHERPGTRQPSTSWRSRLDRQAAAGRSRSMTSSR